MRFLSLFAGIGGFDLGLERAGMKCVGQVEIDPYCQAVLKKHWPDVKRIGDIRDVKGDEFGPVDLVCGGFPCQPFSTAGKRKGKEDDRYLWPEMLRVIKATGATWVIGENVAGIIGVELDKVLSDLGGNGYQVQCFIIPACAVDAPHRRDRVWIVAHSECGRGRESSPHSDSSRETFCSSERKEGAPWIGPGGEIVSNSGSAGLQRGEQCGTHFEREREREREPESHGPIAQFCEDVSDPALIGRIQRDSDGGGRGQGTGAEKERGGSANACRWPVEPELGRVAYGISNRSHRLKALGNAVVPQVLEEIGKAIMRIETEEKES